jgi:ABC-type hemin transport system substrate-binding protein
VACPAQRPAPAGVCRAGENRHLGGDVTEIVYALGAASSLVARDSTSQWPQAANALPDVGYLRQLNAEGILSMRPTLVLASARRSRLWR